MAAHCLNFLQLDVCLFALYRLEQVSFAGTLYGGIWWYIVVKGSWEAIFRATDDFYL